MAAFSILKRVVLAIIVPATLFHNCVSASAQIWKRTAAPTDFWRSVAMSADGKRIIAAGLSGHVFISTNFGETWIQSGVPLASWNSAASSADGSRLIVAGRDIFSGPGWIYTSTDFGMTWISNSVPRTNWQVVACSTNGLKLIAGAYAPGHNYNYCSTDGGSNWTLNYTATGNDWYSFAPSSDASKLVAVSTSGFIYTSANLGTNWTQRPTPIRDWFSAASSANGTKCYAACISGGPYGGQIYASTNSGTNWILTSAPATNWTTIASSADGNRLVAAAGGLSGGYVGPIYLSTDSGSTWTVAGAPITNWTSVACSTDGTKLVAASAYGGIYVARLFPPLSINSFLTGVKLSWTASWGGFVLQCNDNLNTTNWQAVTNSVIFNSTTLANQVAIPLCTSNRLYRLATP